MQFTRAEEYGIRGIVYLAAQEPDHVITLSEIATEQCVPEKFLAKIFQNLTKMGLVRSHRGVRGGFTLGKSPDQITMKDVVEAIQGRYRLGRCMDGREKCERYDECPLRTILEEAESKLLHVFAKYKIADMVKMKSKKA